MELAFIILGSITIASAMAAMRLPNLVHCALCLVLTFGGLAGFYLLLGAEFVGFAQVLVYVGAVAILIVFAILLTRNADPAAAASPLGGASWLMGLCIAALALGTLIFSISHSRLAQQRLPAAPEVTVKRIGDQLMTAYVLPLEVIGLLLTAAMMGAVIIAMQERKGK
jgi:NADH-quinone oxidoreductase subunit J